MTFIYRLALVSLLAIPFITFSARAGVVDASSEELGLYPARTFRVTTGKCPDCRTSRQALWYFQQEYIAVPASAANGSTFGERELGKGAVTTAAYNRADDDHMPPLVWLGSSKVINGATLSASGKQIDLGPDGKMEFSIVPKLPTNLSYYNDATRSFYTGRPLRLRGEVATAANGSRSFIARTIWPQDLTVKPSPARPLTDGETLRSLVTAEHGGAKSPFATRVLWQRGNSQDWSGKAIVALMLNGAQGDDDEAHGGHFGVVTGRYTDGSFHHWLVNNFYGINSISEKGILAGVTPMDKYLMDLNNGQSFYRPSYMLVGVLKNDKISRRYQAEIDRVFNKFYKHDFEYHHAQENCSGISADGFHQIGWNIPAEGNSDEIKAIPAYAYVAATSHSLRDGRKIYDYLTTESTRLFPAAAFDAMGDDMLALARGTAGRKLTDFERELGEDLEAIVFVRIPQVPSSRAYGQAPVLSFTEYLKQAPPDRTQWKIIPTEPRPFPEELREHPAQSPESPVPLPVAGAALAVLAAIAFGTRWLLQRRRK